MAPPDGREDPPLIEVLRESPQHFEFFQAVLLLEQYALRQEASDRVAAAAPVGETVDPAHDAVRFASVRPMAFPPSEVSSLREEPGKAPELATAVIGLLGHAGVLPPHYRELVLNRLRKNNDPTLAAFLDAICHRTVSLFVRAWKKYRLAAQAQRPDTGSPIKVSSGILGFIDALIGFGTGHLRARLSPPHEILRFYAGAYSGNPRSAAVLEAVLSDYFGEPIVVDTFRGRWEPLAESERTRLVPDGYCRLGGEALIGERIMRPEGGFRIMLGPLSYERFRAFLPDGQWLGELVHLARLFAGEALHFDVQPSLRKEDVPELQLRPKPDGDGPRLGWNTWLISVTPATDRDDAVLGSRLIA
jgi:type VI secretion system protein ImpH